ncbi:hypothetical protein RCH11_001015 [Glaciihabitans sp. GrIS 2.15]|nr:hypothetical protein [Glaciihabitans sp. GrIS 2.15]
MPALPQSRPVDNFYPMFADWNILSACQVT